MFDFAWSEIALIGVVGLLFIGPKDMPVAIRTVTNVLKKGRKLAGEFQTHVDEMVREADLGEARDQLRQLRSMNVRGQIMRAIDEDGSIKRTLATDPLAPAAPAMRPYEGPPARPAVTLPPAVTRDWQEPAAPPAIPTPEEDAEAALSDPAPAFLPPGTARRLRVERALPSPPRFVPPRTARPSRPAAGRHVDAAPLPWRMPRQEPSPEPPPGPPPGPPLGPPLGPPPAPASAPWSRAASDPDRPYPLDAGIS